ncbi:MAG TPA: M1 family aminopeptidase, partial [Rhodothermales bacterium]|nr:M1 family aminopeptidase [Rhodothermales bacterium]
MINFNSGGRNPGSLYGVTAHEAAHEWFYGMIATNENDFAWMDEGFTDWATDEALQALFNAPIDPTANTKALVALRQQGIFEPLSKPADWYDRNRAYSQAAYAGGAMIADLLGYVLSDSVRDRGFREYVRRYTLRHPQPADVERTFEHVSGVQLDWFFEQLTRTSRRMDYKVRNVDVRGDSTYIRLHRRDPMFFPIDVRLTMADGSTRMVTIPTSEMFGAKPVGPGWTVARPWGFTFPWYTLAVPGRVNHVQLDPDRRTPDRNRLNDASRFPMRAAFLKAPVANEAYYSIGWRPLLSYADDYGVGVGARMQGTYWLNRLNVKGILTLWPQVIASNGRDPHVSAAVPLDRSWLEGIDYAYRFETGLPRAPVTRAEFRAEKHLGILAETFQVRHAFGRQAVLGRDKGVATAWIQHQYQPWDRAWGFYAYDDSDARGYGDELTPFLGQQVFSAGVRYEIGRGMDRVRLTAETGATVGDRFVFTDVNGNPTGSIPRAMTAHRVTLDAQKSFSLGPLRGLARTMLGIGDDNLMLNKRYRLGQASFEDTWRNAATRTAYSLDERVLKLPFAAFSGVGPVGYFNANRDAGNRTEVFVGGTATAPRMWAGSVEVGLPQPVTSGVLAPLGLSAFSGAAILWGDLSSGVFGRRRFNPRSLVADAGVGASYDVSQMNLLNKLVPQSDVLQSLRLTVKLPLWLSDPEKVDPDEDAFAFRYLFGIQMGW